MVVSVQFGEVEAGEPLLLVRMTPEASAQDPRCPVVTPIGVAVTTKPSEYPYPPEHELEALVRATVPGTKAKL